MIDKNAYPNFAANFKKLADGEAIPKDTDPGHIGENVIKAIDELSEEDIKMLCRIAKTACAHLFVHDKNNNVVAMGL